MISSLEAIEVLRRVGTPNAPVTHVRVTALSIFVSTGSLGVLVVFQIAGTKLILGLETCRHQELKH